MGFQKGQNGILWRRKRKRKSEYLVLQAAASALASKLPSSCGLVGQTDAVTVAKFTNRKTRMGLWSPSTWFTIFFFFFSLYSFPQREGKKNKNKNKIGCNNK